ncbi:MAG: hypothetical protein K5655_03150 [Lachnospiraceae bacterium]|nr:hypothetical protein [Lachnospiraceae bacterium]
MKFDIKGYTYGYGAVKGTYKSERAARSREALMETGINWVCLKPMIDTEDGVWRARTTVHNDSH